ncbi:F-box protein [Thalictrum thalictroides]|uniref:F-box protein n=1 Tax=Thalictrum thalictroides TaxID=46969 RepID=A0A7J6XA52_THATH|nr:F-box protein [Thalictrum thalictroides]
MINILDDDILVDILTRVSAKSLDQIRYFSKYCFNMISDPYFVQQHNLHCSDYGFIIHEKPSNYSKNSTKYFIKMNDGSSGGKIGQQYNLSNVLKGNILACCNGLVLLQSCDKSILRVVNPTTKQQLKLQHFDLICNNREFYGFAFVPSTHEYKIARLHTESMDLKCELVVLNSSHDLQWRSIDGPSITMTKGFQYRPYSVGGVLYWIGYSQRMVLCLDVGAEKFYQTTLPDFISLSKGRIIGMGSFLCLLKYVAPDQLDIWILKNFRTGEWIKKREIFLPMQSKIIECLPIWISDNGELIVFRMKNKLWAYNVELHKWTKLPKKVGKFVFWGPHVSSIVSPKFIAKSTAATMYYSPKEARSIVEDTVPPDISHIVDNMALILDSDS